MLTNPGSLMGPSELMDPPTQTTQRAPIGANVHVRINDDGYISVSIILEKK